MADRARRPRVSLGKSRELFPQTGPFFPEADDRIDLAISEQSGHLLHGIGQMELKLQSGEVWGRVAGQEWEQLDETATPDQSASDPAAFLQSARNVQLTGSEEQGFITPAQTPGSLLFRASRGLDNGVNYKYPLTPHPQPGLCARRLGAGGGDLSKLSGKSKRITIPERLVRQMDRYAAEHGQSRSGLIAEAAMTYLAGQTN